MKHFFLLLCLSLSLNGAAIGAVSAASSGILLQPVIAAVDQNSVGGAAGTPIPAGGAPATPDPCPGGGVQLSVPIVAGQTCVPNNAARGGVITAYIGLIIRFLGKLVGAVVLLMVVIAGIMYITSGGNPERVKAAKKRLINAITALMLFIFAYAILGFVIPGGVL